jgi:nucleoside-diphosphate-sugar epimerase
MKIAIFGCDYIGFALAENFVKHNHVVTAITKTAKTLNHVKPIVKKSTIFDGNDINGIAAIIKENDIIILTVTADRLQDYENTYLQMAQCIKKAALNLSIPKTIIFTSKSLIYGDHQGMWVDEDASLNAKDEEAKILIDTENTILSLRDLQWKTCILRLAQIYGPGRELQKIITGVQDNQLAGNGSFYTNMVLINDVINAVNYVIDHNLHGIFNISDDDHPTRLELTDYLCKKSNLPPVKWDAKKADMTDVNKRVSNYRIKEAGFLPSAPYKIK